MCDTENAIGMKTNFSEHHLWQKCNVFEQLILAQGCQIWRSRQVLSHEAFNQQRRRQYFREFRVHPG